MSKFTKSENTKNFDKLVDEVRDIDPVDIVDGYVYGEQARTDRHYTLVITPELGTEDDETYITLNVAVLVNDGRLLCLDGESSVELGYYDGVDKNTVFKAYNKVIKAAKAYGLYITELTAY